MSEELSDKEKKILGHQAIESFIDQFKPADQHSIVLLEVIFEMLMRKKRRDDFK